MADIVKYYGLDFVIMHRTDSGQVSGMLDGTCALTTQLFDSPDYVPCGNGCQKKRNSSFGHSSYCPVKGRPMDPGFNKKSIPSALRGVAARSDLKPVNPFNEKKSRTQIERFRTFDFT